MKPTHYWVPVPLVREGFEVRLWHRAGRGEERSWSDYKAESDIIWHLSKYTSHHPADIEYLFINIITRNTWKVQKYGICLLLRVKLLFRYLSGKRKSMRWQCIFNLFFLRFASCVQISVQSVDRTSALLQSMFTITSDLEASTSNWKARQIV